MGVESPNPKWTAIGVTVKATSAPTAAFKARYALIVNLAGAKRGSIMQERATPITVAQAAISTERSRRLSSQLARRSRD